MFIPGRKRQSDGIQCMCRKTLGGILKFDRHCSLFLNPFYGAYYAFFPISKKNKTLDQLTQLKSTASVLNISDVAVTIKFD